MLLLSIFVLTGLSFFIKPLFFTMLLFGQSSYSVEKFWFGLKVFIGRVLIGHKSSYWPNPQIYLT